MASRPITLLRGALALGLALAFIAGMLLPVYTDEVGWRFQERAAIDGVDKLFSETCGLNTLAVPPFFMMPARWYSAIFNQTFADPFWVRASGVLYALIFLTMLLLLMQRLASDKRRRNQLGLIALGLVALANMPLMLVVSRPEQPILLAVMAALLLAIKRSEGNVASVHAAWLRSLAIAAVVTFALSYHLKAIFLLPVFLACLFFASRGSAANVPRIVSAALIFFVTALSARYWIHRLDCPDDARLAAFYDAHNFGAHISGIAGPDDVIEIFFGLLGNMEILQYILLTRPMPEPMSDWLAAGQISAQSASMFAVALLFAWLLALAALIWAIFTGVRDAFQAKSLSRRLVLACGLLGCALVWSATQLTRNVYEATFFIPLLVVSLVFFIANITPGKFAGAWIDRLAIFLGLSGIASLTVVATIWGPSLSRASEARGYVADQELSISTSGYGDIAQDITASAELCGIPPASDARAILVDDVTYFALMESRLPQHHLGVLGLWKGSIGDPLAYLRSRGSDGIVLSCAKMPAELRVRARQKGDFCCLGREDLR